MNLLYLMQFASTEESSDGLMGVLGVDWATLIFQIIAFLILLFLLGKFVYPWLIKSVDERQEKIEASTNAAAEAEKKAAEAKVAVDKLIKQARKDASEIVQSAKDEATAALEAADAKSKERAERIVADAQAQIDKDVVAAKKALHNETLALVALATEKVVGNVLTNKVDESLIKQSIKDVQ